jgi:hypothetical protein
LLRRCSSIKRLFSSDDEDEDEKNKTKKKKKKIHKNKSKKSEEHQRQREELLSPVKVDLSDEHQTQSLGNFVFDAHIILFLLFYFYIF